MGLKYLGFYLMRLGALHAELLCFSKAQDNNAIISPSYQNNETILLLCFAENTQSV